MNSIPPSIVTTVGLCRDFGVRKALQDVSIQVGPGEVHAILGHNGAGKTTLFKLLLGLLRPTSGSASILGLDTWDAQQGIFARKRTGDAVLESSSIDPK